MMIRREGDPPYRDRNDAGRVLAQHLERVNGGDAVVYAIPRGGIPVAVEVALQLALPLDIVVPRKIPIPDEPEAGYGAVTEDGVIVLNEPLVRRMGLTRRRIEGQAREVGAEIGRRLAVFRTRLDATAAAGKTAIVIDDGLASGYTMLAAVRSLRQRGAARVVATAPVASSHAWELVKSDADEVVAPVISSVYPFAVARFYRHWHDLTDEEVFRELERYAKARRNAAEA